jgi:sugar fermentation stimulation protein A
MNICSENSIYQYPSLIEGILVKRYKRFMADIQLDNGEIVTAHCPNTGPMTGVCQSGNRVQVSVSDNPKRKLAYTWEMICINDVWVGVNTGLPNQVVKLGLEKRLFPELDYINIKPEFSLGKDKKSRIDFFLSGGEKDIYLEVKNTTWSQGNIALFPDTVTTRGQKHLRELKELSAIAQVVMLYFINRGDCDQFCPGDTADPEYGKLLREAVKLGLKILPCRFQITPQGIEYLGLAELAF